jgi:NAD(P)-dependent dehydrogenase (short-subunit alcohol dehydrogenase family)
VDLFGLDGKVAVVTGGTRGIGLMIARGLLQAGAARVYVSSRKPEAGEQAVAELAPHGEAVSIPANLSSEEECVRLAEEVREHEERVHILVNNAGATWGEPIESFPASAWDKVLDLNLKGPFFVTRAFLPLLEAAASDDPARVINVGSIDGLRVPELPVYSYAASKAGVHQLTRLLARELGPRRITVNAIAPGPFESKMMAATLEAFGEQIAASAPLGRIGRPDDMAGAAIFLSSRAGSYVTGAILPVDGGIYTAH